MTSARTRAVRASIATDGAHGAVVPPIYLSSNFTFEKLGGKRRYDYTRSGNPTRDSLAEALAELECAAGAVVTSSGMSAIALVLHLLRPHDELVVSHDCYGGTHRLVTALADRGALRLRFVDTSDAAAVERALDGSPAMLWIETPSNPLMRVTDIERACTRAHRHGTLVCVDNTFLSPALQQPLTLGADLVVHSTTKYLNGHSDVVGGAVCAKDAAVVEDLAWWANCLGLTGAPFDSFLTLRGIRTLHARVRAHEENAARIAEALCESEIVSQVHYPGLPHHPGHAIAKRQQSGFGGMLSFDLVAPDLVAPFTASLRHFCLAESLGGVESLIAHPATMTHAAMPEEAQRAAGIHATLLRLSVGIESADDLVADLDSAASHAAASRRYTALSNGCVDRNERTSCSASSKRFLSSGERK